MSVDVRTEIERLKKALEKEDNPLIRVVIKDKIEELEKSLTKGDGNGKGSRV